MRARAVVAALATVGLLGLIGCGASEKNDYVDAFNKIQRTFERDVSKTTEISPSAGLEGYRKTLGGIASSVDSTAAKLRALEPPDEVRTQHDSFVKALRDYSKELRDSTRSIEDDDPTATIDASGKLLTATAAVTEETTRLTNEINEELQN